MFYSLLNSILRVKGRSDDMVLLRPLEANCVPILTYAIENTNVANRDERRSLRVAYISILLSFTIGKTKNYNEQKKEKSTIINIMTN